MSAFRALRILMGKCTNRHLFSYGGMLHPITTEVKVCATSKNEGIFQAVVILKGYLGSYIS